MDILGVEKDIADLTAKVSALETQAAALATALEAKTAADVNALADKILEGLKPMIDKVTTSVDTFTVASSNGINEIVTLARRVQGAAIHFELGPDA